MAEQITVSRQALSKWELGTAVPNTENVLQISRLFGVSTDYLLHDEYESDGDLPAVHTANAALTARHKALAKTIAGGILTGLSALGLVILGIIGSVSGGAYVQGTSGHGGHTYVGLRAFWVSNNLEWLLVLLYLLLAAGLAILVWEWLSVRYKDNKELLETTKFPFLWAVLGTLLLTATAFGIWGQQYVNPAFAIAAAD